MLGIIPLLAFLGCLAVPVFSGERQKARRAERSNSGYYCDVWTIVTAFIIACAYATCNTSSEAGDIPDTCQEEVSAVTSAVSYNCGLAMLILGTAAVLECFHVLAYRLSTVSASGATCTVGVANGTPPGSCRRVWTLFGWHDSECMLIVYALLFVVYGGIYFDEGHHFQFADPFIASYRPISTLRYLEWWIASPMLMCLTGRSIPRSEAKRKDVAEMIRPAAVVTSMYILCAWLALAVDDFRWRWVLLPVSLAGYAFASLDQWVTWTRDVDYSTTTANVSVALLGIQIVTYGLYGVIMLLATTGLISSVTEQIVYTFADSSIKLVCSAMLTAMRNADSLAEARKARVEAHSTADDLARMLDTANAPIFAVDNDQRVTLWNRKLTALTGSTLDDVLGRPLEDILSADCVEDVRPILDARKNDWPGTEQFFCSFKAATDMETDKGDSDVRKVSVIMTATTRHDAQGRVVGMVGVGQDLTEVTRYRAIEKQQNQFMAVVSHELKSPLHGIIGLAGALTHGETNNQRKEQLKMVKSCATRLLDLVTNIMEMSNLRRKRQEEGKKVKGDEEGNESQQRKDPVDIPSIVSEVCTLVRNATDKGNRPILSPMAKIENTIPSSSSGMTPIVEGDAYKMTQVFYNLITNACKFCTSGVITISTEMSKTNDRLEVSISDTGIGIAPDAVKRIFEPFEQESNTEKRNFGGIGLGLAISREVVRLHGGDITVKSTLGEGSTFTVSLPVTPEAVKAVSAKQDEVVSAKQDEAKSRGESEANVKAQDEVAVAQLVAVPDRNKRDEKLVILSVDDDVVNQEVVKSALSDKYEIHVAMNGFEAMEYFSTNSKLPHLVLLDVMMPGMDGFEVLSCIRGEKRISPAALPIIMVSAMEPVDKAIIRSLSSGSNDYVTKPFDPDILRARVHTALQIRRLYQVENENYHYTRLLHDIMPSHIVQRLILGDQVISERHDSVCMLFSDIVGWTSMAEKVPTSQLIGMLNNLFSAFDDLTEDHGVFKAETIGDAYIVATGHDGNTADHTRRMVDFGLAMLATTKRIKPPQGMQLQIRVGIHTGPAYTGVVGNKVPKYTFFGDTVNVAARMETTGVPGCINLSPAALQALENEIGVSLGASEGDWSLHGWFKKHDAALVDRDNVEVKGKGLMRMHLVCPNGVSPPLARRLSLVSQPSSGRLCDSASIASASFAVDAENQAEKLIAAAEQRAAAAVADARASSRMEAKLKDELATLKRDHKDIVSSERAAREEVEKLRLSLAEANARFFQQPESDRIRSSSGKSRKRLSLTSLNRGSSVPTTAANSGMTRSSSRGSFSHLADIPDYENEETINSSEDIEALRLQLLVTTKALMRARRMLMDKEEEIDEKELQLQMALASENQGGMSVREDLSESAINIHSLERRDSFLLRTQNMLEPRASRRRSSASLLDSDSS